MQTIAAIATGPAAGGIGIIRVSGPQARAAVAKVVSLASDRLRAREAMRAQFSVRGEVVDEGLVLWFPGPRSYTGEDVVELHAHGSPTLLRLLLEELLAVEGVRLAHAGEFTRRAFLAGRLDLARAEAVADLVAAESATQVRAAAAQLAGELSRRLDAVGAELLAVRADLEGVLDFPDEAEGAEGDVGARLAKVRVELGRLVSDGRRGALVRRGAKVVLYGPVNAGKSTLFNRLSGAERAIVDSEPGTTRDALEARLEVDGLAMVLVDTAGLREGPGRIEAIGIERTREALAAADLAVLVLPPDASVEATMRWRAEVASERRLEVLSKVDLLPSADGRAGVSGVTGQGVDALRRQLVVRLVGDGSAGASVVTSERHLDCLTRALQAVERAETAARVATLEVVAGEVGVALYALAEVTGADASTDLLDAVFARFCIGK